MDLPTKLAALDRLFPAGWTLERRKQLYSVILLEAKTMNIYAGEAKPDPVEAIDSALTKFYENKNFYDEELKGLF